MKNIFEISSVLVNEGLRYSTEKEKNGSRQVSSFIRIRSLPIGWFVYVWFADTELELIWDYVLE